MKHLNQLRVVNGSIAVAVSVSVEVSATVSATVAAACPKRAIDRTDSIAL